jgi:hypothetical protein
VTVGVLDKLEGSEPQVAKEQAPTAFKVWFVVDGLPSLLSVFELLQASGKKAANRLRAMTIFFMVLSFEKQTRIPTTPSWGA